MKKIIICMLTVLLAFAGSTLALAASNDDGGFSDAEGHMRVSAARRFSDVFGKALSRLP